MSEFQYKRSEFQEKASEMPAVVKAHDMLIEVCGPRSWNDTRESWLARGARRAGITLRRARAIFYQEPIRLDADEYLAIERSYQAARAAVAAISILAGNADLSARGRDEDPSRAPVCESQQADRQERTAADAFVRPAE